MPRVNNRVIKVIATATGKPVPSEVKLPLGDLLLECARKNIIKKDVLFSLFLQIKYIYLIKNCENNIKNAAKALTFINKVGTIGL